MERAIFAAGCFWGVEQAFARVPGVLDTQVGYSGGHVEQPTYQQVCTDSTGHAEVVEVTFDPAHVSYTQLLDVFFASHDPTQKDRQGPDVGSQYRSAIFTVDEDQAATARAKVKALEESGRFSRPIVTEITPAGPFWRAEEHHQRYFEKQGGGACHV
jgi:peptide-methionine (S)-S-oxide reductase